MNQVHGAGAEAQPQALELLALESERQSIDAFGSGNVGERRGGRHALRHDVRRRGDLHAVVTTRAGALQTLLYVHLQLRPISANVLYQGLVAAKAFQTELRAR